MTQDETQIYYWLGQRDMLASILAETMHKIKLPAQAKLYKESFEEHFSHQWHVED